MTTDRDKTSDAPGGFSLRRWSQRKLAAAREAAAAPAAPSALPLPPKPDSIAPDAPRVAVPADPTRPPLPSIESLTSDSDFTPFMRRDVDRSLQQKALRKLFTDPRFNVMDGLDVYIDDYSKPDPISADMVAQLAHARTLFDPPATRVENGVVVDVPPSPPDEAVAATAASSESRPATLPGSEDEAARQGVPATSDLTAARAPAMTDANPSPADSPNPPGIDDKQ
jgi:hypothetical protein